MNGGVVNCFFPATPFQPFLINIGNFLSNLHYSQYVLYVFMASRCWAPFAQKQANVQSCLQLEIIYQEKERKNLTISLCLPTLNEEKTIAKEIIIMKSELMTRFPLVDELVVIDSGSTDDTVAIARSFGADVYVADEILPHLEQHRGKGENLWKALYITKGDIIVYIDADIKNIHTP